MKKDTANRKSDTGASGVSEGQEGGGGRGHGPDPATTGAVHNASCERRPCPETDGVRMPQTTFGRASAMPSAPPLAPQPALRCTLHFPGAYAVSIYNEYKKKKPAK
ncbi:unnamed protein product, partial [Iphiclides podalirius]